MRTTTSQQIEMNFNRTSSAECRAVRGQRRRHRARWWFQQMRLAVDKAMDWKPVPPPRPEQIYMPLK
ncbi:MAG: hypothetical protein HY299_21635 [Verrucomicrobia bacterium]|nr:hypothetical protein [Verrucomicrobiota bacterium]